jgi:hypothetical protein
LRIAQFELRRQHLNQVPGYDVYHDTKEIFFNPCYTFAGINYDHLKSGTSMDKRKGFQDLLQKAYAG